MRFINLFIALIFCNAVAFAQVTITNATFPVKGDSLKTLFKATLPTPLDIGMVGGPFTWDFSILNSGTRINEYCLDPKDGAEAASFPTADLMIKRNQQTQYFKSSATKIEALGFGGQNGFIPTEVAVKYTEKPAYRIAPLTFIATNNYNGKFNIDLGVDIIPDTILASLPIKPDSIRVQFVSSTKNLVDAYGKLKMQGKTNDVLREKSETTSEVKFFAKLPFLGWQDVGAILGGTLPGGLGDFLGKDTTITYNFYSNVKKEILVSADYSPSKEFLGVTFADLGGIISATQDINNDVSTIELYPNPTTDKLNIKTNGWKDGSYFFTMTDINGRVLFFENAKIISGELKTINISNLPTGQYVFSIRDQFNKVSSSKKVIKH